MAKDLVLLRVGRQDLAYGGQRVEPRLPAGFDYATSDAAPGDGRPCYRF